MTFMRDRWKNQHWSTSEMTVTVAYRFTYANGSHAVIKVSEMASAGNDYIIGDLSGKVTVPGLRVTVKE